MAVFNQHAYIVTDGAGVGLQIVDLSDIDNGNVTLVNTTDLGVGFVRAHNVFINEDTGFLYLPLSNLNSGSGFSVWDLNADPVNPTLAGTWIDPNPGVRCHDVQIVSYTGPDADHAGKEIAFCFAENNGLRIVDVSNKAAMLGLSFLIYPNTTYCHQGWMTDDQLYVLLGDELDERDDPDVTETTTYVIDISDLDAPFLQTTYTNNKCSIDHNLMVRGNRAYHANYTTGLRVFDISDINAVTEVAFFDTRPEDNAESFNGLWGVFTDFPSGVIVASDRQRGLFVLNEGNPPIVLGPILPGVVDGVNHDIRKQRFLSINPNNPGANTRMRFSLLDNGCSLTGLQCADDSECKTCVGGANAGLGCGFDVHCAGGACVLSGETCNEQSPPVVLGFVGDPFVAGGDAPPNTLLAAVVSVDPGFRVWDETLIHITDCEVAPGQVYRIEMEDSNAPGLFAELVIRTTPKPDGKDWGDLVGSFDGLSWSEPNGLAGVDDVLAMVKFLTLQPAPHITVIDLVGPPPLSVNIDANGTDLLMILKAFKGELFPPKPLLIDGYPDLHDSGSLSDCTGN
jgi:choice-of-anchor B domain-containing protein